MKHTINSIFVGIVTWIWAWKEWGTLPNSWHTEQYLRPWIHRVVVPWWIDGLEWLGFAENISTVSVVTTLGIGFYVVLALLVKETRNQVAEWKILAVVLLGLWFFNVCRAPYDLMTAFLWTWALLFIVRQNHVGYMLVFPLVCLNRIETAPLLIVAYYLRFPKMYGPIIYSIGVVITTFAGLNIYFADVPGSTMWIEPMENLIKFAENWQRSLLHVFISVVLFLRIVKRADYQPLYFQRVFVMLSPLFLVLYFIFGQAFELRVFWELWPIISILILL